jgi:arylesterase/paraoxonase
MRLRRFLVGLLVVLLVVAGFTVRTLYRAGTFRTIEPHFEGSCRPVEGAAGPEDLTIHPRKSIAYVSSCDRRALQAGNPVPGAIYSYDLDGTDAAPLNLTPDAGISFQPHGISLWSGDEGGDVLFVVNHPPAGLGFPAHTIEVFDVESQRLVHRATLTDPRLVMPNDLVAVGRDRFYVTNTHGNRPGFWQDVETYLQLPRAKILSYDQRGFNVALDGLLFPNGINVSPDGGELYLPSMTGRTLLVYERDAATGALSKKDEIFIDTSADNLEVDGAGRIWIGAHPKLLQVQAYMNDPASLAPSQVVRVEKGSDGKWSVDEIYADDGKEIAAATAAAVRGDRLLIGQIFGKGFLDCWMAEKRGS